MKKKDNFLIGNKTIERAMAEFRSNDDLNLLPDVFEAVRKRMNEDGHFLIPIKSCDENGFMWLTLQLQDGSTALVAFTDPEEAEKGQKVQLISNYIAVLLGNALNMKEAAGIILNPWGNQVFISRDNIQGMFELNKTYGDGKRIRVENDSKREQCIVDIPQEYTVADLVELEEYYQYALETVRNMPAAVLPAVNVTGMNVSEVSFNAIYYIHNWLDSNPDCGTEIMLFCTGEEQYERYDTAAAIINAQRAARLFELEEMRRNRVKATKNDWNILPMPECRVELSIERYLDDTDKEVLRYGNVPKEMEDKWFWYVEDEILYAHRSWSGNCIYMIDISGKHEQNPGLLRVIINHDMEQHPWTVLDEAVEELNELLNWWTQPEYDYYGEWMAETAAAIKKQEKNQPESDDKQNPGIGVQAVGTYEKKQEGEVKAADDEGHNSDAGVQATDGSVSKSGKKEPISDSCEKKTVKNVDKTGFNEQKSENKKKKSGNSTKKNGNIKQKSVADETETDSGVQIQKLIINRPEYMALAVERDKKFIVLKGSTINPNITGVMPPKAMEMRTKGLENGFITGEFKLLEDVVFGSSSAAAAFVVGHTVSGPKTWKTK